MKIICAANVLVLIFVLTAFGEGTWVSHGPFGGDVVNFTFHPKVSTLIFAVAGSSYPNDIYRSLNGGKTWKRVAIPTGYYVVRIHPSNPNTVIAAGTAVYSSIDQGTTWQPLTGTEYPNQPFEGYQINDLEFHPTDRNVLYAVGQCFGVSKSTDGGRTWTKKNKGLSKYICTDTSYLAYPQLEVDSRNGNVAYLSLSGRIFKTNDGGTSWSSSFRGLKFDEDNYYAVHSLVMNPIDPNTLYAGGFFGVFKTENAGKSWFSTNCSCAGVQISIDPNKPQNLYASGDGLYKSTSGGETWSSLQLPDSLSSRGFLTLGVHPTVRDFLLGGIAGLGIYTSTSGGKTWKRTSKGLDALHIPNLAVNAGLPSSLFAASGTGPVYRSLDQGTHWASVKDLTTDYLGEIKIHPRNSNVIVACSDPDPGISTDGGETWTFPKLPIRNSASVAAFHPQDPQTIYVGTSGGGMVKTTDLGKTWKVINSGLGKKSISAIAVDPGNGTNLFVATKSDSYTGRARVFKSVNGGTTWTSVSTGLNGPRILSLAIDPTNPATLYLVQLQYVFYDFAAKFVYKSIDSGQHWVQKTRGLPSSFFGGFDTNFITVDPSNSQTLFSIGWNTIYTSTDGAENWSKFSSAGLESDVEINTLQINPAEPQLLYIGTSRGVFSLQR